MYDDLWIQCNGQGPANLSHREIPSRLFRPVFESNQTDYLKCLLEKSSKVNLTSAQKNEMVEIAFESKNVDTASILVNDINYRPLFEAKDSLERTLIQQKLYDRRFTIYSFHLKSLVSARA